MAVSHTSLSQDTFPASGNGSAKNRVPYKKCWEYSYENTVRRSIQYANDTVFVSEGGGIIKAISPITGQAKWTTELGGEIRASVIIPGVGISVVTSNSQFQNKSNVQNTLRLLNMDSGLALFAKPVETDDDIVLARSGSMLLLFDNSGTIIAFDPKLGELLWTTQLSDKLTSAPAVIEDRIVVATADKLVSVISSSSGKIESTIRTDRLITSIAVRENGMILVGDDRGNVINYRDVEGGIWWRFKSGAKVGAIAETRDGILVASFDNFLYLISKYSGDVKWKTRLDGRLVNKPGIIGNEILITVSVEDTAVLLDLDNGRIVERIELGKDKYALSEPLATSGNFVVFSLPGGIAGYSDVSCVEK